MRIGDNLYPCPEGASIEFFLAEPILYETEAGFVVVQGDDIILSEKSGKEGGAEDYLRRVAEGVKKKGIGRLKVSSLPAKEKMEEFGIETSIITDDERDELDSRKFEIIAKAGLASDAKSAFESTRARAIAAAEKEVSEASSKEDHTSRQRDTGPRRAGPVPQHHDREDHGVVQPAFP